MQVLNSHTYYLHCQCCATSVQQNADFLATHPEFAGYGGRTGNASSSSRNSSAVESMHPYVSRRTNSITGGSASQHDDGPSVTEQLQSMGEDMRQKFYSLASKWTAKANEVVAGSSSTAAANSGSSSSSRSHANANVPLMSRDDNDGSDDDKAEVVSFDTDTATTRRATGRSTSANASSIPNSSSSGSSSSSSASRPVAKKDK
jgi:hypothetical protein